LARELWLERFGLELEGRLTSQLGVAGRAIVRQLVANRAARRIYRFSSADATSSSPVVMTVEGREPTATDPRWVASHAPSGATMAGWGVKRKESEFPGCDVFVVNDSATGKEVGYYFYAGNWLIGRTEK
jgi:hypothetical protein